VAHIAVIDRMPVADAALGPWPASWSRRRAFGAIFLRPTQILDDLGSGATDSLATGPDRDIAGISAECFSATLQGQNGDSRRAEWCFSKDGVLLSSLVELAEEGTSRLEAIDVQRGVSDADFEAVPPEPGD
jgi:hypothetical protein